MTAEPKDELAESLPPGMREDALREAVEMSGYPLQTVVAGLLADREYQIGEEWAWRDPKGETERTLDILAEGTNRHWHHSEKGRILVVRSLLIECKQSRNPYLGFTAVAPPSIDRHPGIVGLNHTEISLYTEDENSFVRIPLLHLLGLRSHSYLREPLVASSLSRAHPNGKRVEVSGDEPFNSLVRPLTKAANMFREHWNEPQGFRGDAFTARLIFPIAVIDAPLFSVRGRRGASELLPTKWMRIFARHAAGGPRRRGSRLGFDVVDLVAADYFETFLDEHLAPFVSELVAALSTIQDAALTGSAHLPGYVAGEPLPFNALEKLRAYEG